MNMKSLAKIKDCAERGTFFAPLQLTDVIPMIATEKRQIFLRNRLFGAEALQDPPEGQFGADVSARFR